MGHWYTKDGEPMHYIVGANGKERDTNLRDARKLNLFPSYTGIADQLAKPGLEAWKQNNLLYAALTTPRPEGISDDEFLKIVRLSAAEEAEKAKLRGNEIHDCIEALWKDNTGEAMDYPPDVMAISSAAIPVITDYCLSDNFTPEKTFASPLGYGGMIDLVSNEYDNRNESDPSYNRLRWLVDYKTKDISDEQWQLYEDKKNPRIAYPNNLQQLVVYDRGLGQSGRRLLNVYIDRTIPGRVILHEWTDMEAADREFTKFMDLLHHWQTDKQYAPES